MIKVNLLPIKRKKKAKQVPMFVVASVLVTLVTTVLMLYLIYYFNSRIDGRKKLIAENDSKIAELDKKIKDVADFEKRNQDFKTRKEIIEQLSKSKTIPVKVLDEISAQLPNGVWLISLDLKGLELGIACTAFTNTDVVNYVNNLKNSKLFSDVYLKESVQAQAGGFSVYNFSVSMKVNG
ncbi:MAG: PilN domain-containing protein [Nitrospirae bacterium]|nr:PilN domain-containing protein [Nitrospirota bacterium]